MFTGQVAGLRFHAGVSLCIAPSEEEEEEAISRYVAVLDRRQVSLPPLRHFSSVELLGVLGQDSFLTPSLATSTVHLTLASSFLCRNLPR